MGGGVCKVIFMSNPTVVLRLGWGFDKNHCNNDQVCSVNGIQVSTQNLWLLGEHVKRVIKVLSIIMAIILLGNYP